MLWGRKLRARLLEMWNGSEDEVELGVGMQLSVDEVQRGES
jgi:hypothetical protein